MQSGAIQFIETLDRTSLTVSDSEFEKNVEAAVSAIAERNREAEAEPPSYSLVAEKSAPGAPEVTPRNSLEGELYHRRKDGPTSSDEDNAAVTGLLRTIQKPLSTIGRIFSDESESPAEKPMQQATPPQLPSSPRPSPGTFSPMRNGGEERKAGERPKTGVQQRENTALMLRRLPRDKLVQKPHKHGEYNVLSIMILSSMFSTRVYLECLLTKSQDAL